MGDGVRTGPEILPVTHPDQMGPHTFNIHAAFQENNTLNVVHGLNFPPESQVRTLEEFHPGFVKLVVEEWQNETTHRQNVEMRQLEGEISSRDRLEEMKHDFYMDELKREDSRMNAGLMLILLLIAMCTICGIIMFFLGKNVGGGVLMAPLSASGVTAVLKHLKNRGK